MAKQFYIIPLLLHFHSHTCARFPHTPEDGGLDIEERAGLCTAATVQPPRLQLAQHPVTKRELSIVAVTLSVCVF